jgi:sporulation protein YqfC
MLDSCLCYVDNFKSLLDFSSESVRISTSEGVVRITGKNLEISSVTDESISIKGVISSLEFE